MAQEIEKKFLVLSDDFKKTASAHFTVVQGYLSSNPERTVRVRIKGERGYITVKGITNDTGISRYEWEKEIPVNEAAELLHICEPGIIEKVRYEIIVGRQKFEIDEFYGENKGLVIAEIELGNEAEPFERPSWLGKEVTGEIKYYNSILTKKPFSKW